MPNQICSLKEKLDKLEKEYYYLQDWFGKYDQLIWTFRSLLFTIYAAVIMFSFSTEVSSVNPFYALTLFALFFLAMEVFWLLRYWRKRTQRYRDIQVVVNSESEQAITEIPLVNMDNNLPEGPDKPKYAKPKSIFSKIDEPLFFYAGLILISMLLFSLI